MDSELIEKITRIDSNVINIKERAEEDRKRIKDVEDRQTKVEHVQKYFSGIVMAAMSYFEFFRK